MNDREDLAAHIMAVLGELTRYPDRHVGGEGNRAATGLFARTTSELGFEVSRTAFDCVEWEHGDATIDACGARFEVHVGPYSPSCDVIGPLVVATNAEELESEAVRGAVVLIAGDLAKGQVMPKNFTFYNPDSHRRIVRALEDFAPAAVVAATGRDPEMVGSQYPFPLFEDGDLDVPTAYMKDVDGVRLAACAGGEVRVRIDSRRVPASGEHVVATLPGDAPGRIVLSAHIDSRVGSPGALDNGSGVAVLLAIAGMLQGRTQGPAVEMVPFNGEDDYANPGEMLWVAQNEGRFEEIILGINIDDAGQVGGTTHVSFYGCPPHIEQAVRDAMSVYETVGEGPQWFQSDHAIFGIYGRPAIAIASSDIAGFMAAAAHSERDTIELADPLLLADIARFLHDVIAALSGTPAVRPE